MVNSLGPGTGSLLFPGSAWERAAGEAPPCELADKVVLSSPRSRVGTPARRDAALRHNQRYASAAARDNPSGPSFPHPRGGRSALAHGDTCHGQASGVLTAVTRGIYFPLLAFLYFVTTCVRRAPLLTLWGINRGIATWPKRRNVVAGLALWKSARR